MIFPNQISSHVSFISIFDFSAGLSLKTYDFYFSLFFQLVLNIIKAPICEMEIHKTFCKKLYNSNALAIHNSLHYIKGFNGVFGDMIIILKSHRFDE